MVVVQVTGLKEVKQMLNKLPKNIREEIGDKAMKELAKNLQRRMRNRVNPKGQFSTGWLRRSIMVEKAGKQYKIVVHALYGAAVEEGSMPHPIPIEYLEQHTRMPEAPGQWVDKPKGWVMAGGVGARNPFASRALASFRPAIPNIIKRFLDKAIQKSK